MERQKQIFRKGFTLIELAAVMGIMVLLLAIAIPMLGKAGIGSQTKVIAHQVEGLFKTVSQMARSSGRIYVMDFDLPVALPLTTASTHVDYDYVKVLWGRIITGREGGVSVNRFQVKQVQLYTVEWDDTNDEVYYRYAHDGLDIPSSVVVSLNDQVNLPADAGGGAVGGSDPRNDHIYFMPDGAIQAFSGASTGVNVLIYAHENAEIRYKIEIDEYSGHFVLRDYHDSDITFH